MTTYYEAYCNATTDLLAVLPDLNDYDRKESLTGWVLHADDIYKKNNSGEVTILFKDGADLGSPEANIGAVTDENDWFYDSAADVVYIDTQANDPDSNYDMEKGQDWTTVKTEAINRASDFVRSYINKPIVKRTGTGSQSESLRDFEDIIIQSTAIIAVSRLVRPYDFDKAGLIESIAYDKIDEKGYLDRIKKGEISLWDEATNALSQGIVRDIALNASSTGGIADLKGDAAIDWDLIKVIIITGGTFVSGTASAVTYSVFSGDSTGLKISQDVTADVIDGSYQDLAHGLEVRFSPGVYTASDEWEIEVNGQEPESGQVVKQFDSVRF